MTFYLLCVAICLASLSITAAALTAPCEALQWIVARRKSLSLESRSRAAFVLRVLPFVASMAITVGLVLPSFLLLEPIRTDEAIGARLASFSAFGALACAIVAFRFSRAWIAGMRLQREWKKSAIPLRSKNGLPVYRLPDAGGLVATTGIFSPAIFVSSDVASCLTERELEAALAHEVAHVRASDNFKRLLMRSLSLPIGTRAADQLWTAGTEVAADFAALRSGTPVLELASALVKVARLNRTIHFDPCAASSLIPAGHEHALSDRIRRLRLLIEGVYEPQRRASLPASFWVAMASMAAVICSLPSVQWLAHEMIEKLV